VNPMEAVVSAYRQYFRFQGRSSRSEFWWFYLFWFIVVVILGGLQQSLKDSVTYTLVAVFVLGSFLPFLAVTVRRLHDTGRSGFWIFIDLIPILGTVVLIVFWASPGQAGANSYGPPPGVVEELPPLGAAPSA
jgi:uncharacterized membrane protein YhaH (DUF805 family)